MKRCFDETGWAFLFAPTFHASTRHAVAPRRELGARTAFNLLGPLTNPARPEAQVVGVPRVELLGFVARCLKRLGARRAWVVHGSGLDELGLAGPTRVAAVGEDDQEIREIEVSAADAGLADAPVSALRGGDSAACAAIARRILEGDECGPCRDVVVLNAAAALLVARRAQSLREGAALAASALDDSRGARLLDRVVELSRS
jgi:anthranilate phosphoribosyltransferase